MGFWKNTSSDVVCFSVADGMHRIEFRLSPGEHCQIDDKRDYIVKSRGLDLRLTAISWDDVRSNTTQPLKGVVLSINKPQLLDGVENPDEVVAQVKRQVKRK